MSDPLLRGLEYGVGREMAHKLMNPRRRSTPRPAPKPTKVEQAAQAAYTYRAGLLKSGYASPETTLAYVGDRIAYRDQAHGGVVATGEITSIIGRTIMMRVALANGKSRVIAVKDNVFAEVLPRPADWVAPIGGHAVLLFKAPGWPTAIAAAPVAPAAQQRMVTPPTATPAIAATPATSVTPATSATAGAPTASPLEFKSKAVGWLHTPAGVAVLAMLDALGVILMVAFGLAYVLLALVIALAIVDWSNTVTLHGLISWSDLRASHPRGFRWAVTGMVLFGWIALPTCYAVQAWRALPDIRAARRAETQAHIAALEAELFPAPSQPQEPQP